jgi:Dual specificity phosphatase, catalytic domain
VLRKYSQSLSNVLTSTRREIQEIINVCQKEIEMDTDKLLLRELCKDAFDDDTESDQEQEDKEDDQNDRNDDNNNNVLCSNALDEWRDDATVRKTVRRIHQQGLTSVDQVTNNILLGNCGLLVDQAKMKRLKISRIMVVAAELKTFVDDLVRHRNFDNVNFKVIDVLDGHDESLLGVLADAFEYIELSLDTFARRCGGGGDIVNRPKLLILCCAGVSRSAALLAAYQMLSMGKSAASALRFVRRRRDSIRPNDGFLLQLLMFERILERLRPNVDRIITALQLLRQNPPVMCRCDRPWQAESLSSPSPSSSSSSSSSSVAESDDLIDETCFRWLTFHLPSVYATEADRDLCRKALE